MRGLSLKRMFAGFLTFASAAVLGAVLTPQEGYAGGLCENQGCRELGSGCRYGEGDYCHSYDWTCFDGGCED